MRILHYIGIKSDFYIDVEKIAYFHDYYYCEPLGSPDHPEYGEPVHLGVRLYMSGVQELEGVLDLPEITAQCFFEKLIRSNKGKFEIKSESAIRKEIEDKAKKAKNRSLILEE